MSFAWVQLPPPPGGFKPLCSSSPLPTLISPQLQSGIRNTFMLAQIIVSTRMRSRLRHHEDHILFIPNGARQRFHTAPG